MHVTGHAMLAGQWSPRRRMSCWCQRDIISQPGQGARLTTPWSMQPAHGHGCGGWPGEAETERQGQLGLTWWASYFVGLSFARTLREQLATSVQYYNPNFNNTTGFSFNIVVALRLYMYVQQVQQLLLQSVNHFLIGIGMGVVWYTIKYVGSAAAHSLVS